MEDEIPIYLALDLEESVPSRRPDPRTSTAGDRKSRVMILSPDVYKPRTPKRRESKKLQGQDSKDLPPLPKSPWPPVRKEAMPKSPWPPAEEDITSNGSNFTSPAYSSFSASTSEPFIYSPSPLPTPAPAYSEGPRRKGEEMATRMEEGRLPSPPKPSFIAHANKAAKRISLFQRRASLNPDIRNKRIIGYPERRTGLNPPRAQKHTMITIDSALSSNPPNFPDKKDYTAITTEAVALPAPSSLQRRPTVTFSSAAPRIATTWQSRPPLTPFSADLSSGLIPVTPPTTTTTTTATRSALTSPNQTLSPTGSDQPLNPRAPPLINCACNPRSSPGSGGGGIYNVGFPAAQPSAYTNTLLAVDDIPRLHDILAAVFGWVMLAGFIILPATYVTDVESHSNTNKLGARSGRSLTIFSSFCIGASILGAAFLAVRWRRNYAWLLNRVCLPTMLYGLAGMVSTLVMVYAQHGGRWAPPAQAALGLEVTVAVVCAIGFGVYSEVLLKRLRNQHVAEMEWQQRLQNSSFVERIQRMARAPSYPPASIV